MHLYTPIDGRSLVIGGHTISSTGMQFDNPMPCLEETLGSLLLRSDELADESEIEPEIETEIEIEAD